MGITEPAFTLSFSTRMTFRKALELYTSGRC